MKNFLKITFVLLFALTVGTLFFFYLKRGKEAETPQKPFVYKSVIPGQTTHEEAVATLGNPKNESQTPEGVMLEYASRSPNRSDLLLIKEGKVYLIKEVVTLNDGRRATYYTDKLGKAEIVLYGEDASAGFYLYAYPSLGLAYIAGLQGTLLEVWYFSPTNEEEFRKTIAPQYLDEPEERQ